MSERLQSASINFQFLLQHDSLFWFHRAFGKGVSTFKPRPFVSPVATDRRPLAAPPEAQVALKTTEADSASTLVVAEQLRRCQLKEQTALPQAPHDESAEAMLHGPKAHPMLAAKGTLPVAAKRPLRPHPNPFP